MFRSFRMPPIIFTALCATFVSTFCTSLEEFVLGPPPKKIEVPFSFPPTLSPLNDLTLVSGQITAAVGLPGGGGGAKYLTRGVGAEKRKHRCQSSITYLRIFGGVFFSSKKSFGSLRCRWEKQETRLKEKFYRLLLLPVLARKTKKTNRN